MEDKLLGLLGLARRAGLITFGFDAVLKDVAGGKAGVVVLSSDAAPRTVRNIKENCEKSGAEVLMAPVDKAAMGHAIGRGETAVLALTDKAFSARVTELCRRITGGIC
jgi:ribosomal protein L7Ae-like RNA K-turn-binding protein